MSLLWDGLSLHRAIGSQVGGWNVAEEEFTSIWDSNHFPIISVCWWSPVYFDQQTHPREEVRSSTYHHSPDTWKSNQLSWQSILQRSQLSETKTPSDVEERFMLLWCPPSLPPRYMLRTVSGGVTKGDGRKCRRHKNRQKRWKAQSHRQLPRASGIFRGYFPNTWSYNFCCLKCKEKFSFKKA